MRLAAYSDDSLRLLMYAALKNPELVTIQEVADAYRISRNRLMEVAFRLGRDGFLDTVRGRAAACAWRASPTGSDWGKLSAARKTT